MSEAIIERRPQAAPSRNEAAPSLEKGGFAILCLGLDNGADSERLALLKHALVSSPLVLRHMEASGAFNLVLEVSAVDVASYYRWLIATTRPFTDLIRREETSFSDSPLCETAEDVVVWVPQGSGRVGLRRSAIDRIVAERDYVRIYADGRDWQVLATLQSFEDLLAGNGFVRVHRSTLVRLGAVRRMARAGGRWFIQLDDGSHEQVARNRVAAIKAMLKDNSKSCVSRSSSRSTLTDLGLPLAE
ncbi:MAG: LytTR family DNA-binding domain-containing protein [Croceibacterium sp.]